MSLLGEFVRVPEVLCYKFFKKGSLSKQWDFDDIHEKAVRRAIIEEIRRSPLGALQKLILISSIRGAFTFLPAGVKSIAKRVLSGR